MWKSSPVTYGLPEAAPYFILLIGESQVVINGFSPKLLPAVTQSCGLLPVHSPLYTYYAVSYAIQLPAFNDTNKVLFSPASKIL
jgi:hypothetical protein